MAAATSTCFVAKLPESVTDHQLEKLVKWAHETCVKSDVVMTKEGRMHLVAIRKEPKTARDYQRLLRTNLQNWGAELPAKQTGWLKLVAEDQYEAIRHAPAMQTASADNLETRAEAQSAAQNTCHEACKEHEAPRLRLPVNLLTAH